MASFEEAPLYLQIATRMSESMRNGTLAAGEKLPSVRETARLHGVAQSTVVQAYHWLEDARLIQARPRSGFYVTPNSIRLPEPSVSRPPRRAQRVHVDWLGVRALGNREEPGLISFGSGTPSPEMLDPDRVRRALVRSVQRHRDLLCTYPEAHGQVEARRALARYALSLGCNLDPGRITITGGCMESVSLCLRAATQSGDVVALETPTHFSFLELLQSLQLKALEVPTHPRQGLSLDALQLALDTQPVKAVLLVPTLSNPLGSCMPLSERRRLAAMAARHGVAVIEDAIYNDLAESEEMRRSVKSYDSSDHVMLCHSFSKTLAPGLRLGWLEAGRWTDAVRAIKDVQTGAQSVVLELALADLLSQAGYAANVRQLQARASARLNEARGLIAAHFPKGTRVTNPPGGFLLWLELPKGLDAVRLHSLCLEEKILVAPGNWFSNSPRFHNCLRIGVGGSWSEAHPAALKRVVALAGVLMEAHASARD